MKKKDGGTRIGEAMEYAGRVELGKRRRDADPVLIVFTDGNSEDNVTGSPLHSPASGHASRG